MKVKRIILLIIIILLVIIGGIGAYNRFSANRHHLPYKEYLHLSNKDSYRISVNGSYIDGLAYKVDGKIYVPLKYIKEKINARYYYNKDDKVVLYSLPNQTVEVEYCLIDKEPYISIDSLLKYSMVKADVNENPNIITLFSHLTQSFGVSGAKTNIRLLGGIKSPIVYTSTKKEKYIIIDKYQHWSKVICENGVIGYIKNNKLKNIRTENINYSYANPQYPHFFEDKKICMAWHLITNKIANNSISKYINEAPGLNVVSPTWFAVSDSQGSVRDFSDKNYVLLCHSKGIKVWAMLENMTFAKANHKIFLHHEASRKKIIDSVIHSCIKNGIDGINLDFESISQSASEDYIQFIRELGIACHKVKLSLSVDNYVPKNYNKHYAREEQSLFGDYIVIMGYDEHISKSPDAGSVASIGYVRDGIENTIKEVKANQVINAVPAYTRIWEYNGNKRSVRSISLINTNEIIKKYKLKPQWSDKDGQYYVEFKNDKNHLCKLWIEDEESLKLKLQEIENNSLAGVAMWRLGFATKEAWNIISSINK